MPYDEPPRDLPPLATPEDVDAVDAKVDKLRADFEAFKLHDHGGVPVPIPDPTQPELPGEIPAGKEVAVTDLVTRMSAEPIGTVFRVRPGMLERATLPPKDGHQVWMLDPPNTLLHGRGVQFIAKGPAKDTVWGYLRATGYCPANPAWTNVSVRTNPALYRIIGGFDGDSLPSARLHKAEIFECGRGVTVGHDMVLEDCDLHHCHHMNITGFQKRNVKVHGGKWHHANIKPDGVSSYYTLDWEVSNKFTMCTDLLIDDYKGELFESFENRGPGVWPDINNDRVTIRHFKVYKNKAEGIHHEVSFQGTIEDGEVWENGGAANILVANSRATATNRGKVQRVKSWGHWQWEIALQNTAYRPNDGGGLIDFWDVVDNTIDAAPNVAALRYHKYGNPPYPTSLVTTGNKRSDGTPVLLTHSQSP